MPEQDIGVASAVGLQATVFDDKGECFDGGDTVAAVVEVFEEREDEQHGLAVGEHEGLGRDHRDRGLGRMGVEVVGDFGQRGVLAGQNHYVAVVVVQVVDLMPYRLEDVGIERLGIGEGDAHIAAVLDGQLPEVGLFGGAVADIEPLQLGVGREGALDYRLEEAIVELDNVGQGAVVGLQRIDAIEVLVLQQLAASVGTVDLGQLDELAHIALTETVDSLLAVAHHERLRARLGGAWPEVVGHCLVEERDEVLPLQLAGVLELVDQVVIVVASNAFVDERCRLANHFVRNALVEFRDVDYLVLIVVVVLDLADAVEQRQRVEVGQQQLAGVVLRQAVV